MWPSNFDDRLRSWVDLRSRSKNLSKDQALLSINDWWMISPWRPYYLHWDDRDQWPDPWQLLSDNVFCDLARALGIVYTLGMIWPEEINGVDITETDQGNLVILQDGKYILNWAQGQILNNPSQQLNIRRTMSGASLPSLRT